MAIVGHSMRGFLTVTRLAHGKFHAVQMVVTRELHATKGWRTIRREKRATVTDRTPSPKEREALTFCAFARKNLPRTRGPVALAITEKMLMRHSWYRRQCARTLLAGLVS